MQEIIFPVGYQDFHADKHINFQLNRWYSLGYVELDRTTQIGQQVIGLSDWKQVLVSYAEQATLQGDLLEAAFLFRAAEFFTAPSESDKAELYDRFTNRFYAAVEENGWERLSIPYQQGSLPALRFKAADPQGVIVIHGGLDSFMEEFYSMARYLNSAGYEVVLFDGPGQGAALRQQNLFLTHEWEKPVGAVLDHLTLSGVTLIGISLGGFLALRAAAFEPRVARAVAYDVYIYDHRGGSIQKVFFQLMRRAPSLYNRFLFALMGRDATANHMIQQWMYVCGVSTPFEWAQQLQRYSVAEIVKLVQQDVLLLAGRDDHLIPVQEYYKHVMGLINASSVSGRIFTSDDQAQNHCQIGNIQLALDHILEWIESKS